MERTTKEEEKHTIIFNRILCDEMGKCFDLQPLPLDPDLKLKYTDKKNKNIYIKSELLGCAKTAGIRYGEMNFDGSMMVNFGSVPPGSEYDFPILGYTFVLADKYLICVLDLHPISKENKYLEKYLLPLKDVSQKYQWIPKIEGGRSEVHDWAKQYDSGYALYRWCEGKYLNDVQKAFKDYIHVFCDCIKNAEVVTDQAVLSAKEEYMEKYRYDYAYKDPGGNPLKNHFGEKWGERFMNSFLFTP